MTRKTLLVLIAIAAILCACNEDKKKEIVCWGDSLTAPHGGGSLKGKLRRWLGYNLSYPQYLEGILSDDYRIVNAGVGGENTLTIMARQGAYPMQLAHDVVIFKSDERKYRTIVGNNDMSAFVSSYNGQNVTPLLQCGYDDESPAQVNPCNIDGKQFELSSEAKFWKEDGKFKHEYNYYIEPSAKFESTDTIKAGSVLTTFAMENLRGKYANVLFIGQNGGFDDVADLIKQLQAMISYSQSDRYIVISFHKPNKVIPDYNRMKEMEDSLYQVFGGHFINLRQNLSSDGQGEVEQKWLSTDNLHFNSDGYKRIANLVADKMKELGY